MSEKEPIDFREMGEELQEINQELDGQIKDIELPKEDTRTTEEMVVDLRKQIPKKPEEQEAA